MKWVWNAERTVCFDIAGNNSIFLEAWSGGGNTEIKVFLNGPTADYAELGSFESHEEAREWVSCITGAVWAGNGQG